MKKTAVSQNMSSHQSILVASSKEHLGGYTVCNSLNSQQCWKISFRTLATTINEKAANVPAIDTLDW